MPKILSLFKWVVDEAYIKSGPTGNLDLGYADYKISDYDKNAIEESVVLVEKYGGNAMVATVGLPEHTKGVKDALSRGPERAYFINDPSFIDLEPGQTASILADAISSRIEYDIIICGEGSSDLYAQQVGPRLAEKLGIPCLCYVQRIEIEENKVIAECKTEDGITRVEVAMPVLLAVVPDINIPRIPGLRDTLAAGKKPIIEISREELPGSYEARLQTLEIKAASLKRGGRRFQPDAAGIKEMVEEIRRTGIEI